MSEKESETTPDKAPVIPENTKTEYPSGPGVVAIFIGLLFAAFCSGLDRSIVATAVPKITAEFDSLDDIAWYGSSYLIAAACLQLFIGKLYAELDVKWVFLFSLLLFEVGSVVCATGPNSLALILGRAVSGIGSAGISSGALLIISRSVALHNRPKFTGALGGASGIAMVVGPTLGGVLTDKITWRWCFWINLPFGAITFLAVLTFVKVPAGAEQTNQIFSIKAFIGKIDLLGTFFLIPWVICLLLALQWGGSKYPWKSWRIILLFVLFAIVFVIWLVIQVKGGDKVTLPIRLITHRSLAAATLYTVCNLGSFFVVTYYVAIWFQAVRGVSAYQSGVNFLATSIAMALSVIASGFITSKIGYYVPNMIASTILSSIGSGLVYTFNRDTSESFWIGALILVGLGAGLGIQQAFIATQALFEGPDLALSTSIIIFLQTLSASIFLTIAENVLQNQLASQLHRLAPTVNPKDVIDVGASGVVQAMEKQYPDSLGSIIEAYNIALQKVFLIVLILSCLGTICVAGMEWVNINKGKDNRMEEKKSVVAEN